MKRHVTHVITKLDVGGAQTHVVELALGQLAAGYQVDVIAGVGGPAAERLITGGVPVTIVPELATSHGSFSQRAAVRGVHAALRSIGPELVHGHSSNGGLSARLAGRQLGLPSVYTAHGWPFQKGAATKQRLMSLAGEFVGGHVGGAVIVLTQAEYDRAVRARAAPRDRLFIVANGIADVPAELRRDAASMVEPTLVMVARFAPPKLQREVLEAVATLNDLAWGLRLVGDGPGLTECQAMVPSLGLDGRVEFLGHRNDIVEILAASDVGVLWSRYEGLPISVMEYMRAGLACVASDLPGTRELLDDGAGLTPGSPIELAVALRRLLSDPAELDRLGRAARKRYESAYSATAMVDATTAVYRTLI